jgi:hypothetical protein
MRESDALPRVETGGLRWQKAVAGRRQQTCPNDPAEKVIARSGRAAGTDGQFEFVLPYVHAAAGV